MIPNDRAFQGKATFEHGGKVYYRSYKFDKTGKIKLKIQVVSINSSYRQGIAFKLSSNPQFNGSIFINGNKFIPDKKQQIYVIPLDLTQNTQITLDLEISEGYLNLANASDFLDDYPDMIEKLSASTGRTREQFRGNSFTSGFSARNLYGNAFWIDQISDDCQRFYCNDHKLDDDFDDLIFDLVTQVSTNR